MSSSIVFRPSRVRSRYSSSFPSSEASAIVTWTPRTSSGQRRRGSSATGFGFATGLAVGGPTAWTPSSVAGDHLRARREPEEAA